MISNRKTGIDLVKVFATFFVVSVHFFLNTEFYSTPLIGKNMDVQVFARMSFLICVPLFLIITGYLQLEKKPTKQYFKKIIPILIIYLFYSIIAIMVRKYYFKEHKTAIEWLAMVLNFNANNYSWYINMFIGLFLLSPYINILYKNIATKKQKVVLILVFLFITGVPTFFNLKAREVLFFPDFWVGIYPLTYYLIGSFIREYQVKVNKLTGAVALLLITLLETFIEVHYANGGNFTGAAGYYSSLVVVIHATIFFLLFYDINIKVNFIAKILSLISILSLDIYLASNITDKFVYQYVFTNVFKSQPQVIYYAVPIVFSTFGLSFLVSLIRHKLIKVR
ncbi:acyltransferase [Neobacillus dielmonensis]|uniref:acyltransferase n=1 Tax=Neobacillus dielmonensis TaxID=1347369 RepID=UPI0005A9BFD1|nr:acyltransferase family protein [Neobacillus dielmonensis]